jgi:hypothetical protein
MRLRRPFAAAGGADRARLPRLRGMELRPLSQGNRLQRAYAAWAAPLYLRLPPELREQAELLDRFLYSRNGLGLWLGLLGGLVGSVAGLRHLDMPWPLALLLALLVWVGLPLALMAAWLQPQKFALAELRRRVLAAAVLGLLGALTGFVFGHIGRLGTLDLPRLGAELLDKILLLAPLAMAVSVGLLGLQWAMARVREELLERARTARQASEARLKLLQAQVQPHFVFNTLAALQHWVDTGDARAPALLRSLSAFLRGSTELLGREQVTLGEELAIVREYLQVMQARLGERLRFEIEATPAAAAVHLPPGLLLTLVENAVEHGIGPALSGGTVRIDARAAGAELQLRVHDDGAGLPAGWQPGTGLANVRERLAHHGGRLELRAAVPGAEALIALPLPTAGAEATP